MAFRSPDPHNLRRAATRAGQDGVYEHDRPCLGCGYNLRGIPRGGKCPECGMASKMPDDIDAPLSQAPTRVILSFIRGCWLASICVAAAVGVTIADRFPAWKPSISLFIMTGVSLLWVLAVMWLTPGFNLPQAAIRGFSPRGKLRRATRLLHWGWVAATCAQFVDWQLSVNSGGIAGAGGGSLRTLLSLMETVGFLAGLAGIVCLSLMLERLAEWTRDDTAEKCFNWAAWSLPISTLLLNVHIPNQTYVNLLITAVWLASVAIFPYALLNLSGSVTYCVLHAVEHKGRDERRQERSKKYTQNVGETISTMDAARKKAGAKL